MDLKIYAHLRVWYRHYCHPNKIKPDGLFCLY